MAMTQTTIPANSTIPALKGAWWKIGTGLLMAYVCYGAFFVAGAAAKFTGDGNTARILFFHLPIAILSAVAFVAAAIYAWRHLATGRGEDDLKSAVGMELGFLCGVLTLLSGMIFSRAQWGAYWNWDPRQTSMIPLLLIYAAYLTLRGALSEQTEKRARLSAAYVLISVVPAMFLIWAVPYVMDSLHPRGTIVNPKNTSLDYKLVKYPAYFAFSGLFVWLFQLRLRGLKLLERCQRRRAELRGEVVGA